MKIEYDGIQKIFSKNYFILCFTHIKKEPNTHQFPTCVNTLLDPCFTYSTLSLSMLAFECPCQCWPSNVLVNVGLRMSLSMLAFECPCQCWPSNVLVNVGLRMSLSMLAFECPCQCWPSNVLVNVGLRKYGEVRWSVKRHRFV